jgi:hypothetical protein
MRFLASRSVTLAGLSILAAAYAGASPAHSQCRNHDRFAAAEDDPLYLEFTAAGRPEVE